MVDAARRTRFRSKRRPPFGRTVFLPVLREAYGRAEQLSLRSPQRIVATDVDSVLRTDMGDPEPQEEHARVLWNRPMAWLSCDPDSPKG